MTTGRPVSAEAEFNEAIERLEKAVRRYQRRLREYVDLVRGRAARDPWAGMAARRNAVMEIDEAWSQDGSKSRPDDE